MTLRASIVSPITWTLLLLIAGWPTVAFVCLPVLFIFDGDVFLAVTGVLVGIWFVLMWAYFLTSRLCLEEDRLTVSSCLRTTSIPLDEKTLIRYKAAQVALHGVNVSMPLEMILGQEAGTHIQITLRSGGRQVKVGSAFKGISALRARIIALEKETILPAIKRRLQAGEKVRLEPFEFSNSGVTYQKAHADLPLKSPISLNAGILSFKISGKKKRVPFRSIWNAFTVMHLLDSGSS